MSYTSQPFHGVDPSGLKEFKIILPAATSGWTKDPDAEYYLDYAKVGAPSAYIRAGIRQWYVEDWRTLNKAKLEEIGAGYRIDKAQKDGCCYLRYRTAFGRWRMKERNKTHVDFGINMALDAEMSAAQFASWLTGTALDLGGLAARRGGQFGFGQFSGAGLFLGFVRQCHQFVGAGIGCAATARLFWPR